MTDSKNAGKSGVKDTPAAKAAANYTEVYCANCKRSLGRYNTKFYGEDKIASMVNTIHSMHVRDGHTINIRSLKK